MDRRMSQSLPQLFTPLCYTPLCYTSWAYRRHTPRRRRHHYYVGGVRTQLIGADSYPNPSGSPRRLLLCGPSGSFQRTTRSSSSAELSRTTVFCSREDLRSRRKSPPRAVSCEDVFRGTSTAGWDSRLSESGVSLNDSRTDVGSCAGLEDVDGGSQYSFGSSSAFHEITCDSEADRPDSDCCLSAQGSSHGHGHGHDRFRDSGHDGESRGRRRERRGHPGKARHDSGSRETFLAELRALSGRSSPRGEQEEEQEFFHSTPTKRGSPVLSIFPADEDDLHFPGHLPKDALLHDSLNHSSADSLLCPTNDSFPDSLPTSPSGYRVKAKDEEEEETESREALRSSMEAVKEALNRRRRQFYASFHDQQQSSGDSVQSWLSTGHPQPHTLSPSSSPLPDTSHHDTHQQQQQQQEQQHQQEEQQEEQGQPLSASSGEEKTSVRDRVRAIEQGRDFQTSGGADPTPLPTPPTPTSLPASSSCSNSSNSNSSNEGDWQRSTATATTTTTTTAVFTSQPPFAVSEGGGAEGKVPSPSSSSFSPQQPHSPSSSSASPGTELTPALLNNEPDSPTSTREEGRREEEGRRRKKVSDVIGGDAERQKASSATDEFNQLSLREDNNNNNDNNPASLSSPSFRDNPREITQGEGSGGGAEGGPGFPSASLSGSDSECLQLINTCPVDQGPEANHLPVSGDDSYANTGAKPVTANTTTPRLLPADAEPTISSSSGGSSRSIPDVYQHEDRLFFCRIQDRATNLTTEGGATSVETQGAVPAVEQDDGQQTRVAGDSGTSCDPRYAVQETEFERLISGFQDNFNEGESAENATEIGSENRRDPSLFHARPIRITSPDSGDNSVLSGVHSSDSTPSSLFPGDGDTAPDAEDAEVQLLLLQGSVDTLPEEGATSTDGHQGEDTAPDMQHHLHLLPTDPALDQNSATLGVMTVREVSQHHARHVHHKRTTVQETVTTRRTTVRGSPSSTLRDGGPDVEGAPSRANGDFEMTDTTVSRITVTERDNEEEETTTRNTTRIPLSRQGTRDPNGPEDSSFTALLHHTTDAAGSDSTSKAVRGTRQQGNSYTDHAQAMLKHAHDDDSRRHVLDHLQDQLSVLSSDHPSLDSAVSSVHRLSPPFGYKDRAEASLPETSLTESNAVPKSVVRGTGSVCITLDRTGASEPHASDTNGTGWTTEQGPDPGSQRDLPLYHATAIQILPAEDKGPGFSTESRQDLAVSSRPGDSSWGLTGSSSEINDSDDRCTPASVSDSHRTHPYSDSDSCAEGRSTALALQDLLSSVQGQLTSDQPSLHRSVDVIEEDFPPDLLHHPHVLQETILEADDEGESTEEDVPAIDSYKSSLHFCVPESTPSKANLTPSVLRAQQQQHHQNAASESGADTLPAEHSLQDLRGRLTTVSDVSHDRKITDPSHQHPSLSQHAHLASSDQNDGSASAEVQQKASETSRRNTPPQPAPSQGLRRLSSSSRGPKKAQWVQDKVRLFQKLLNDFEWQSKTPEQKLMEEMVTTDSKHSRRDEDSALEKQSGFCDDLYRLFTREHLERRQNHVCPVVEDHMPALRFKRFLRKKHNCKLKGRRTVRIRHQLEGLEEASQRPGGVTLTPSDAALVKARQPPYHIHHRIFSPGKQLRGRHVSDVFTDDADVNRSVSSDSAYSSLSGTLSSRNVSDLDATFRSVTGSSADVSLAEDKLRSLSDVFDHPEMFEGDVDEARLDRLLVGYQKAETL